MLRALIFAMSFVVQSAFAQAQNPLVGLWYYIDKKSIYWEEVYTDSLFWVYSDEVGTVVRRYEFNGQVIKQTYKDGTPYTEYTVTEVVSDRISFTQDGETGVLRKIKNKYDFKAITRGDSVKFQEYVSDYRKRKHKWESRKKLR